MATESSAWLSDLSVDDFYFSALIEEENQEAIINPVSDEMYAEALQFQEALMASSTTSTSTSTVHECLAPELAEPLVITMKTGESSLSFCEICCERKEHAQMFESCCSIHSSLFCCDCISRHAATRIQGSGKITIRCPGLDCQSVLEYDSCKELLPREVLLLWEEALCEEMIDATSQRFYCPFKDCSAMLVHDESDGECVITESECPFCHRLFCAQCSVTWHAGVECEEFQRLNVDERGREDLMVRELAKEKNWSRCPHCSFYVERTEGCPHITCRCKFEFCYGCGSEWTANHGGCSRN